MISTSIVLGFCSIYQAGLILRASHELYVHIYWRILPLLPKCSCPRSASGSVLLEIWLTQWLSFTGPTFCTKVYTAGISFSFLSASLRPLLSPTLSLADLRSAGRTRKEQCLSTLHRGLSSYISIPNWTISLMSYKENFRQTEDTTSIAWA